MDEMSNTLLQNIKDIEERDEGQILAELAGETVEEFIYETDVWDPKLRQKVRKVKLSWVGTREAARAKGNIIANEVVVTDLDDVIRIVAKYTDISRNFSVFGGCHQPRKMKVNDYDDKGKVIGSHLEDDPFCFQKGLSKAQRNAMTSCIPAQWTAKMIDRFMHAQKQLEASGKKMSYVQGKSGTVQRLAQNIKPRVEWDKISKDMVSDYGKLEQIIWDLAKLQPADMYKQLGGGSRSQMTTPAWDAFLALKEQFTAVAT